MTDEQFWERVRQIAAAESIKDKDPRRHGDLLGALLGRADAEGDKALAYSILRTYSGMEDHGAVWPDGWNALIWEAIHHAGTVGESNSFGFLDFAMAIQQGDWWSLVSPGNLPAVLFESPDQPTHEDGTRLQKLVEWTAGKIAGSIRELESLVRNGGEIQRGESVGYGFDMGARRISTHHTDVLRAVVKRYLPTEWQWTFLDQVGGDSRFIITSYRPPRIERIKPEWRGGVVAELSGGRSTAPLVGDDATAAIHAIRTGRVISKAEMTAWGVR